MINPYMLGALCIGPPRLCADSSPGANGRRGAIQGESVVEFGGCTTGADLGSSVPNKGPNGPIGEDDPAPTIAGRPTADTGRSRIWGLTREGR